MRAGYELRVGEIVLHARVDDGRVEAAAGALPGADLAIEAGPGIRALMAGELSPADAIANGTVKLTGDAKLLDAIRGDFSHRTDARMIVP